MSSPSPATPPLKAAAAKHLALARQNYDTYHRLEHSGQDLDWAVTVLFYTALHLMQAYFVQSRAIRARSSPSSSTRYIVRLFPTAARLLKVLRSTARALEF